MHYFASLFRKLRGIHRLSKAAILIGASLSCLFYLVSAAALWAAPQAADYFYTMSVHYATLEAAPACLAVGICAGLIGDLMLRQKTSDQDIR